MKLHEVLQRPTPEDNDLRKTMDWLEKMGSRVGSGGGGSRIQIGSSINLSNKNISKVPVRIDIASSTFDISHNNFKTLEDCGLPLEAVHINISYNPIRSLIGISDIVKRCGSAGGSYQNQGVFDVSGCPITSGGLGFILIEDLWDIRYKNTNVGNMYDEATRAFDIIRKYLPKRPSMWQGEPSGLAGNIYECQTELIDAGLEAYAQL